MCNAYNNQSSKEQSPHLDQIEVSKYRVLGRCWIEKKILMLICFRQERKMGRVRLLEMRRVRGRKHGKNRREGEENDGMYLSNH
jgi:hypothetical protein